MNKKNSKKDLIWIIVELIGSVGIGVSAAMHIKFIPLPAEIGLMEWVFQVCLVLLVLNLGFKMVCHACEELKNVQWGVSK